MKNLLFIFLLLSLFFEGFSQTCPTPDPCTVSNQTDYDLDGGEVLCITTDGFDLGDVDTSLSNGETAVLYIAQGISVDVTSTDNSIGGNGTRSFIIINEGTMNYVGDITLGAGIVINNCATGTLNADDMGISNAGVVNNLGTINLSGGLTNNNENGGIYNGGTFNVDGTFTNNGVVCGPDVGCGVFSVGGSSSNPTGSFGADAGGVDCGNVDICDVGNDGFQPNNGITGSGGTVCSAADCFIILPVELISFTSKLIENGVSINWETTSETNNAYFWIEKSRNGSRFEVIGKVEGNGTSNAIQKYEFIDNEAEEGVSYYRLNQIAYDGTSNFSKIIASNFTTDLELKLTVFPNPNNGEGFSLRIRNLRETSLKAKMLIYSSQGQVLVSNDLLLDGSDIEIKNKLAQGSYFIELRGIEFNLKKRLMIQ